MKVGLGDRGLLAAALAATGVLGLGAVQAARPVVLSPPPGDMTVTATEEEPAPPPDAAWITAKVKTAFLDDTALEGSEIKVETKDRLVTLYGTVSSEAARARAVEIARSTTGVSDVDDQLTVVAPQ